MSEDSPQGLRQHIELLPVVVVGLVAMAVMSGVLAIHNGEPFLPYFGMTALVFLVAWPATTVFFMILEWMGERHDRA